jgi:hypothetical protein
MLHFEAVWLYCTATVEKKSVLPDDTFKFFMNFFPKYANTFVLFIRMLMPVGEVVLLDYTAYPK